MNVELANKIRSLKPSKTFVVQTELERVAAMKMGKEMKRWGKIDFDVTSRKQEDGTFKIGAL